ncbi:S41 family peptidase [Latilactobacillus fuchuensis]|uniref:S41 family peptidase n=1 Tax=Latilactobacillus fuchuensis TaxID=164393 RepID=UPI0039AF94C3
MNLSRCRQKKSIIVILNLLLLLSISGHTHHQFTSNVFSYQQVITYMSKNGIIQDRQQWSRILSQSANGQKINNIHALNSILVQGNKHSSAASSMNSYKNIDYPSTTIYGELKIINIPSFSSENKKEITQYINSLHHQISVLKADPTIILNFANNQGGNPQAMLAGISDLLPNGILFTEVSRNNKRYDFTKNDQILHDSRSQETTKLPNNTRVDPPKIYIITDETTASAAEFSIIALKQNKQAIIIGYPTAGYTSTNTILKINHQNEVANITNGTVSSKKPIGNKTHFNNDPLTPDITTLYRPISPVADPQTKHQQPLDPDFLSELFKVIAKNDSRST